MVCGVWYSEGEDHVLDLEWQEVEDGFAVCRGREEDFL